MYGPRTSEVAVFGNALERANCLGDMQDDGETSVLAARP